MVAVLAVLYTGLGWSPSSYALALEQAGVEETGLVWGRPRAIRSDEWAIQTPLVQATVRNGLRRYNRTSVYGEDLRSYIPLPVADAGLLFRPWLWGYPVLPPAHAFSLSWAVLAAGFLLGWARWFRALGFGHGLAAAGSVALFAAPLVQARWTTDAPVLAVFPWVAALWCGRGRPLARALLSTWLTATWLGGMFYPPAAIPLAFGGAVCLAALRRDALSQGSWKAPLAGAIPGVLAVGLYYRDLLPALAESAWPGVPRAEGGAVSGVAWLDHLAPGLAQAGSRSAVAAAGANLCETASTGTWLPLLLLLFWGGRRAREPERSGRPRRPLRWLAAGAALVSAWMLLPLPSAAGWPLLWNHVRGERMSWALGPLLLVGALHLARSVRLRVTPLRVAAGVAALLGITMASRHLAAEAGVPPGLEELALGIPLLVYLGWKPRDRSRTGPVLAWVAAAANLIAFGGFNPIQRSAPLFERPRTATVEGLTQAQREDPRGWLVASGWPGALLNGWGFRSVSHNLVFPQPDFFAAYFPHLPRERRRALFHRTGTVTLGPQATPRLPDPHVLELPLRAFLAEPTPVEVTATDRYAGPVLRGGWLERLERCGEDTWCLTGWAPGDLRHDEARLTVLTPAAVRGVHWMPTLRPDVAAARGDDALLYAGLVLAVRLREPTGTPPPLCVVYEPEGARGAYLLARRGGNPRDCGLAR